MTNCKLCERNPAPGPSGICTECSVRLGIVPLGPPQRPPAPCQRCSCMKFVRVVPREYAVMFGTTEMNTPHVAPMTLTQPPKVEQRLVFSGNEVDVDYLWTGRGKLETYVCTKCGFVEWYCQNPSDIPIGPEFNSDIVDYETDTPYR